MPDAPSGYLPQPVYISNAMPGYGALARGTVASGLTTAAAAYPSATLALFQPFVNYGPYLIRRIGWINGATLGGSVDVGIFSAAGTRILSTGAVAQSGASVPQAVTLGTPVTLPPGAYYWALAANTTTGTLARWAIPAVAGRLMGLLQQASATLPAAMSPAVYAQTYMPLVWASWHPSF